MKNTRSILSRTIWFNLISIVALSGCDGSIPDLPDGGSSSSSSSSSSCGTSSSSSSSSSGAMGCVTDADCASTGNECAIGTCNDGVCSAQYVVEGTPVTVQYAGDCHIIVCDGKGASTKVVDDGDIPNDGNECTKAGCIDGTPTHTFVSEGGSCGNGNVCDGKGACVGCTMASQCPGIDDSCNARTCIAATCGTAFAAKGTECVENGGSKCDGAGVCKKSTSESCAVHDECIDGYCVDGVCCESACTGVCQACSAQLKGGGEDGTCGPAATGTNPDGECGSLRVCSDGVCKAIDGNGCADASACASGYCVDGVCCDSACTDACYACNASDSAGTCAPIAAGQPDPNATTPCTDVCNGAGVCETPNTSCTSGIECASHICKDNTCLPPKPSNGPLRWLTETHYSQTPCSWAWPTFTQIAARNNGAGVAINGTVQVWGEPGLVDGGFNADGYPGITAFDPSSGSYTGSNWRKLGRGGVSAMWQKTSLFDCYAKWPYSSGSSMALTVIGANDAGQAGAILSPCNPSSSALGGLVRYSSTGALELHMPQVSWPGPIVLGPMGEFHTGSGVSLAKYDVNAMLVWSKSPTINGTVFSSAWDVDAAGNILIALSFGGSIDYGLGPMTSVGPKDLGLVKLDPNGNPIWQTYFGNGAFFMGDVNLSRTGAGDMTVWGNYAGNVNFGTGPVQGAVFIAKFDTSGNALWHVNVADATGLMVSGDTSGAVYIGSGDDNFDLGWGTFNHNQCSFAVAKYQE